MADFVLDASLSLAWCFKDERTDFSQAVLLRIRDGAAPLVPALWGLEVGNGIRSAWKRQHVTAEEARQLLQFLLQLPVQVVGQSRRTMLKQIAPLAMEHELSVYDAVYFHLARTRKLPLATLDGPLRRAAEKADWPVIAP